MQYMMTVFKSAISPFVKKKGSAQILAPVLLTFGFLSNLACMEYIRLPMLSVFIPIAYVGLDNNI